MIITPSRQRECCTISGAHLELKKLFDASDESAALSVGAAVINLVNLDGSPRVTIHPDRARDLARRGVLAIDSSRYWRNWVASTFGGEFRLTEMPQQSSGRIIAQPLSHMLEKNLPAAVGLNIGGYLARVVHVDAGGRIALGPEVKLGSGRESILSGWTINSFCEHIASWIARTGWNYECVGFAWAAPRGSNGLAPTSHLFRPCPELAEGFRTGRLRRLLTDVLGCPVSFWNDGEATTVAEWFAAPDPTHSLISLKLGTSVACGAVILGNLCLLPLELAKCIVNPRPSLTSSNVIHPVTRIPGTLREAVGAGAVSIRYYGSPGAAHRYPDFLADVSAGKTTALLEVHHIVSALADAAILLKSVLGDFRLILSGKSVEGEFGHTVDKLLRHELSQRPRDSLGIQLLPASLPGTYAAAIGASFLAKSLYAHLKGGSSECI